MSIYFWMGKLGMPMNYKHSLNRYFHFQSLNYLKIHVVKEANSLASYSKRLDQEANNTIY